MKRKRGFLLILVLCLAFSGVMGVNAKPTNNSSYYLLETEELKWNFNKNSLWQSKKWQMAMLGYGMKWIYVQVQTMQ